MDFKLPYREQNSNKGTFGKILNVSGSANYIGAAYLSSLSALKAGAGFVALGADKDIIKAVSVLLPEAVFLSRNEALKSIDKYDVILIGCGLGQTQKAVRIFRKVIKNACEFNKPVLIDADGLNILAKSKIDLPLNCVITPHPAEAARLLGVDLTVILENMEDSAKKLSEKYNCITVLKSHRTIVCSKEKDIYINQHGNSALAKAGSGDVLSGIIAGLMAQKMDLFDAAKLGVYLHSRAGEIASTKLTEYSVLASDVPKYLSEAIKEII